MRSVITAVIKLFKLIQKRFHQRSQTISFLFFLKLASDNMAVVVGIVGAVACKYCCMCICACFALLTCGTVYYEWVMPTFLVADPHLLIRHGRLL